EPIKEDLIGRRIEEIRGAGVTTAARLSPQRTVQYYKAVIDAGADIFMIRGTTVSAEHVSSQAEPLNLKRVIYELDVPVIVGRCGHGRLPVRQGRPGAGPGLPLGQRSPPPRTAPRRAGEGRHDRVAGADPARPGRGRGRLDEPDGRAAPVDGHRRVLGPEGVP